MESGESCSAGHAGKTAAKRASKATASTKKLRISAKRYSRRRLHLNSCSHESSGPLRRRDDEGPHWSTALHLTQIARRQWKATERIRRATIEQADAEYQKKLPQKRRP
ncbi:uncharacterized protein LOC143353116 [Halictus rubicundus]|uniref:uncharacterized protein LOC143353116 n=1 Tax=Halictus rubicundus TaxID=77578 RepID=UPI0040361D25